MPRAASLARSLGGALQFVLMGMGLLWIAFLIAQAWTWHADHQLVATVDAPDGRISAHIVETRDSGGTLLFHSVRLAAAGEDPRHADRVLQLRSEAPPRIAWSGPYELTVMAPCGRYTDAANHWSDSSRDLGAVVRIAFPDDCLADAGRTR